MVIGGNYHEALSRLRLGFKTGFHIMMGDSDESPGQGVYI